MLKRFFATAEPLEKKNYDGAGKLRPPPAPAPQPQPGKNSACQGLWNVL